MFTVYRFLFALPMSALLILACISCSPAQNEQASNKNRIYEEHARTHFSDLDRKHGGRLDILFSQLSHVHIAHDFIHDDETRPLYKELLIEALARDEEIVDAMFANLLLSMTPPEILLEAIVPELGPKGKLHRILEGKYSDTRKRLERQSPQGHPGEAGFRHYSSYLENHQDVVTAPYLIAHMFRTAPGEAFHALIQARYFGVPYPPLPLSKGASNNAGIRPLLYAEHVISDVIWHQHFRFDIAPEQLAKAKNELNTLSQHKDWWVRLYVAEIMQQHPELRVKEVTERLKKDENELIRDAMVRKDTEAKPAAQNPEEAPVIPVN